MFLDLLKINKSYQKIKTLEKKIDELEKKIEQTNEIQCINILRVKNGQYINDTAIFEHSPYIDITSFKAHEIYLSNDHQFYLLDVEEKDYKRPIALENLIKIEVKDLSNKFDLLPSKMIPLFIISKDGVKSIEACEILAQLGFFNCYNISGGYEKWPINKIEGLNQKLD